MQTNRFKATGPCGEVRVGGRVAVTIGRWSLETLPAGWLLEAEHQNGVDHHWLDSGAPCELRLSLGTKLLRWRSVEVLGMHPLTIRGEGEPDVM